MTQSEKSQTLRPAPLWRRLGAALYDALLLFGVLFVVALPFTVLAGITWGDPRYPLLQFVLYAVVYLYFGWFWTHGGQTLGMKTWRVRLVRRDGGRVDWLQVTVRLGVALLSWAAFGAGFLWALLNRRRATWHDLASGTELVMADG